MKRKPVKRATIARAADSLFGGMRPITVKVAAAVKITGISRSRIYELIRAKQIETAKLGKSTLVYVESLERFLDQLRRVDRPDE